jgi:hypothetical protein
MYSVDKYLKFTQQNHDVICYIFSVYVMVKD